MHIISVIQYFFTCSFYLQSPDSSAKNTVYTVKGLVSTATKKKDSSSSPLVSPKNHKHITPHGDTPTSPTNLNAEPKQHPQVSKVKEAAGDESDNSVQCKITCKSQFVSLKN